MRRSVARQIAIPLMLFCTRVRTIGFLIFLTGVSAWRVRRLPRFRAGDEWVGQPVHSVVAASAGALLVFAALPPAVLTSWPSVMASHRARSLVVVLLGISSADHPSRVVLGDLKLRMGAPCRRAVHCYRLDHLSCAACGVVSICAD